MKKLLSILLVLALTLSLTGTALAEKVTPSSQRFTLDGGEIELTAYNIDGYNYVNLRSLAAALSGTEKQFSADYDAEANQVVVTTGAAYVPDDGAVFGAAVILDEAGRVTNARESGQTVRVDGETLTGLTVWNIGGFNYFKLAELRPYLGFGLSYDEATRTVALTTKAGVTFAADYAEVRATLTAARSSGGRGYDLSEYAAADAEMPAANGVDMDASGVSENSSAAGGEADYSGTNVQVEGVDEGDIVKTDGNYIYVLNGDYQLTVIRADGADSHVVSRTEVGMYEYAQDEDADYKNGYFYSSTGKRPQEMYVSDGRLAVISSYYHEYSVQEESGWRWNSEEYSCVDFYDVRDPANPRADGSLGQDGYPVSSRLMDGRLYLVTRYWVWRYDEDEPGTYIPRLYTNGEARTMPADCIAICPEPSSEYVVVCEYELAAGTLSASQSLLGGGDDVYMSSGNLYVMNSRWTSDQGSTYRESVYTVTEYTDGSFTDIYRFDLSGGLDLAAAGSVPGYMESQFSADENGGYLRIVTTRNESVYRIYVDKTYDFRNYQWEGSASGNGLYILDGDLNVVGSVTDLAPDEYIYSARFDGDIAYFCTYRTVDPLFAVDCADPANPKVLSALKISGFSEYLHNWTEGKLFGFGYEADEDTGRTDGLKLVMFNTADKTDVTVENIYHLDANWSEALYNHKAFFISPEKNIIGFLGDDDYYIFSYDEAGGFTLLSHFRFDTWEYNVRGLYIGDWAYIVGNAQMMIVDMNTWEAPAGLKISEE